MTTCFRFFCPYPTSSPHHQPTDHQSPRTNERTDGRTTDTPSSLYAALQDHYLFYNENGGSAASFELYFNLLYSVYSIPNILLPFLGALWGFVNFFLPYFVFVFGSLSMCRVYTGVFIRSMCVCAYEPCPRATDSIICTQAGTWWTPWGCASASSSSPSSC
jgi:hypothetical protein